MFFRQLCKNIIAKMNPEKIKKYFQERTTELFKVLFRITSFLEFVFSHQVLQVFSNEPA